jgi:hypothetical protein
MSWGSCGSRWAHCVQEMQRVESTLLCTADDGVDTAAVQMRGS